MSTKDRLTDIAIAELRGWKFHKSEDVQRGHVSIALPECSTDPQGNVYYEDDPWPKYTSDLNAMHEAEQEIYGDECDAERYEDHLLNVISEQLGYGAAYLIVNATAKQRAKAFLRYHGKEA